RRASTRTGGNWCAFWTKRRWRPANDRMPARPGGGPACETGEANNRISGLKRPMCRRVFILRHILPFRTDSGERMEGHGGEGGGRRRVPPGRKRLRNAAHPRPLRQNHPAEGQGGTGGDARTNRGEGN